jgi:tubulin polyglutamylase TTLL6/13
MVALAQKHNLSRNLMRMQKYFPTEYDFFPKTWILPSDMGDFK